MILILTTEAGDFSHLKIIDWLTYYGADFMIMTGEGVLRGDYPFTIKNGDVIYNNINLSECVSCVFYRRWYTSSQRERKSGDRKFNIFEHQLNNGANEIKRYLFKSLKSAVWIPNPEVVSVNKLSVLNIANNYIDVPDYIVTNKKSES